MPLAHLNDDHVDEIVQALKKNTHVTAIDLSKCEDITDKGELNGLSIQRIDLLDEQAQTFYVELPIAIEAVGSYHDLGAFISGMAGLPRIVTLHDFDIAIDNDAAPMLKMSILAKTYRYREEDDGL